MGLLGVPSSSNLVLTMVVLKTCPMAGGVVRDGQQQSSSVAAEVCPVV